MLLVLSSPACLFARLFYPPPTPFDAVCFRFLCVAQPLLQLCYKHCADNGAAFMATQFSYECFCSEHYDLDYERHGETECDMTCMGDEV